MWWVTVGLALVSAGLYRLGGMGDDGRKEFPKLPGWLFNTKVRDWGCPIIAAIWMVIFDVSSNVWIHTISFLLFWGALCTYWDRLFKYDNFYMHGFMCGMAYVGFALAGDVHWGLVLARSIVTGMIMGVVCDLTANDYVEEFTRGGALILTLPILLG